MRWRARCRLRGGQDSGCGRGLASLALGEEGWQEVDGFFGGGHGRTSPPAPLPTRPPPAGEGGHGQRVTGVAPGCRWLGFAGAVRRTSALASGDEAAVVEAGSGIDQVDGGAGLHLADGADDGVHDGQAAGSPALRYGGGFFGGLDVVEGQDFDEDPHQAAAVSSSGRLDGRLDEAGPTGLAVAGAGGSAHDERVTAPVPSSVSSS